MTEFNLKVPGGQTRIIIGPGEIGHIGEWISKKSTPPVVLVCADTTVASLHADAVLQSLHQAGHNPHVHTFPPGDSSKSLTELDAIYRTLGHIRMARDGLLLALGGGVVSDLTGFAAATWMRGVRHAVCPTTLEADVDASIGGKTAINHAAGKNLIGAFHHAELVVVDPNCLSTLPARDISAGLAESVKHALIRDAEFLAWHEAHAETILDARPSVMAQLIERNLRIKAAVVEADEREEGLRAILNFGHTVGHAIENWYHYKLRHGEAVSLGMMAAIHLSNALGLLAQDEADRVATLLGRFNLPVTAPAKLDVDAIAELTRGDKKVKGGRRRWVLLDSIGHAVIRDDIAEDQVRRAIESVNI